MWTPVTQSNIYFQNWQSVATNHDGSVLIAAVNGGDLWINTQGIWINVVTEYYPANEATANQNWTCVASNYAGDLLFACADDIFYSSDSGVTWTNANVQNVWTSIACDSTGQKVFATAQNTSAGITGTSGNIWQSEDGGVTWQNMTSGLPFLTNQNWQSIACDYLGKTLIACIKGLDIWTNYDGTWYRASITQQNWKQVAINYDGTAFLACVSGGGLWRTDGDGYWRYTGIVQNWRGVAMDALGQNMFACAIGNDIWTSTDSGTTWLSTRMSYKNWTSIASDASGKNLIACEQTIWLNNLDPVPPGPTGPTGPTGPVSDICFVKDTMVQTDQGPVPIQKLIPGKHTIFKQYILAITETIHTDSHLVKVSAYAFGSYPTKDTYVSKNHKINGSDSFLEAQDYVNGRTVTFIPYHRDPLYNVLCERPSFMKVNGMMAETLNPQSDIALYHKSKRYKRV